MTYRLQSVTRFDLLLNLNELKINTVIYLIFLSVEHVSILTFVTLLTIKHISDSKRNIPKV